MQNYSFFCYYSNNHYSFADLFFGQWTDCRLHMRIFKERKLLTQWVRGERSAGKTIGFVPTMGALHAGHLALVQRARRENDLVVCSIFVNPIQFDKTDDLATYPRMPAKDLALLESAECDAVFCPDTEEMYPEKVQKKFDFGHLDKVMEGKHRKGHFNGVAIVVDKLFNIVTPHRAYFGEKDFQQLQIIRTMVKLEGHQTAVVGCPTVRESDGLAMSSRNTRLTSEQRQEAPRIYKALLKAKQLFPAQSAEATRMQVISDINASPLLEVEYCEIVCPDTLLPIKQFRNGKVAVCCVAVYAGTVRLIDNLAINS